MVYSLHKKSQGAFCMRPVTIIRGNNFLNDSPARVVVAITIAWRFLMCNCEGLYGLTNPAVVFALDLFTQRFLLTPLILSLYYLQQREDLIICYFESECLKI